MKTGFKPFRYTGKGAQGTNSNGSCNLGRSSTEHQKHPYLRKDFWANPLNQFWNTAMYSEASKRYFNESIQR